MKIIIIILVLCVRFVYSIDISNSSFKKFKIIVNAIDSNGFINKKFTCLGKNISPKIEWNNVPKKTKTLMLIVDDPDAPNGDWIHWIVYNIPKDKQCLLEAENFNNSNIEIGVNSWGKNYYCGPCPPSGTHRYYFKLYALDFKIDIEKKDATKDNLLKIIKKHIIGKAVVIGKFKK